MARPNLAEQEDLAATTKNLRDLNTANPLENGSTDRGTYTVRSRGEGLVIDGGAFRARENALIEILSRLYGESIDLSGQLRVYGDSLHFQQLQVGTSDQAAATYLNGPLFARGQTTVGTSASPQGLIVLGDTQARGGLEVGTSSDRKAAFFNGNLWARNRVYMEEIPTAEGGTADAFRVLLINSAGQVHKGPQLGGIGGGTDPGDPSGTGLKWPFPLSTMTSDYGPRSSPGGVGSTFHQGIDFGWYPAVNGAQIPSAGKGTVIFAGWTDGWGNYVRVDHGGGVWTAYAHMSGFAVSVGQQVNQRATLGYIGSTGPSTGPHLHYEVWINGSRVNPRGYTS
ncbi:Membrane proteins related to metalloendopeptidases [Gulosibacter sp. 10]|nr:Membrane proteins related to metalloendopeptidases [Gulosibacter sp. 10]